MGTRFNEWSHPRAGAVVLPLDGSPQGIRLKSNERNLAAWVFALGTALLAGFVYLDRATSHGEPMGLGIQIVAALAVIMAILSALANLQFYLPTADVTLAEGGAVSGSTIEVQWRFRRRAGWVKSLRWRLEEHEVPTVPQEVESTQVFFTPLVHLDAPQTAAGRMTLEIPAARLSWKKSPRMLSDHVTGWWISTEVRYPAGVVVRDRFELP